MIIFFFHYFIFSFALDNGLALTPPMGFLSWQRFRCNTDCINYPDTCISEQLYLTMADHLVNDGFKDAGYITVNIDDCWAELKRAPNGQLVANKERFPHGIKWLANEMHKRGLQLGIYGDVGTKTCGGYPGSFGHYQQDADTFASWNVDSLKLDGCYANVTSYPLLYPEMGKALNQSGRAIVYACSWPAYVGIKAPFKQIAQTCNYWRAYGDIQDDYGSVTDIIDWWTLHQNTLAQYTGPSAWADPDMLILGDFSLSTSEMRVQMALWSIFAAPMLMSNDLRKLSSEAREILLNSDIIAVSQDPLGIQGKLVHSSLRDTHTPSRAATTLAAPQFRSAPELLWYTRPLMGGDLAVVLYDNSSAGSYVEVSTHFYNIGWPHGFAYVRDLFLGVSLGKRKNLTLISNPHGAQMVRLSKFPI